MPQRDEPDQGIPKIVILSDYRSGTAVPNRQTVNSGGGNPLIFSTESTVTAGSPDEASESDIRVKHDKTFTDEINELKNRVEALEAINDVDIESLRSEKVVVLRTIKREDAKKEILELFQSGETLYYSDIATNLRLDLEVVVDICLELMESEEIEVLGDNIN